RASDDAPRARVVCGSLEERPEAAPCELSFVPLSSIHALGSEDAIARHLAAAAASLRPGGVHVIEATHPADLGPNGVNRTEWTEVRGDVVIDARFRMHVGRAGQDRCVPVTLEVVAGKKGARADAPERGRLRQEDRWFIPDLAAWRRIVARVPAFELTAALGDFNVDVPFEHAAAWRLILVLKNRG
ncbi:MAG TPA: hypothetical protein VHB21_05360, partial [Minicystis sp.]|nr:hypothetical protein [Minicystis sp.]